jgi:hypothetical protein
MSLSVSPDLLDRAEAGDVPDEAFVACVRESLAPTQPRHRTGRRRYSQPCSRAVRWASIRLRVPVLPIADDR